jgi:hypothetical protein
LTGDQFAVHHDERAPIRAFLIDCAVGLEHVLHQKRHHLGEANRLFLGIGETGDPLSGDQRLAIRARGVFENRRCMTNRSDGAVAGGESFEQPLSGDGSGLFLA